MSLVSLEVQNIRIYEHATLTPDRHLNIITGANASGKTTLLEAIHLLGTGRSFRTPQLDQLRNNDSTELRVVGQVGAKFGPVRLGLVYTNNGKRMSVNGQEQPQISGLAQHLPLHAISPEAHYDFQNSSKHRRGVLDWCLFHVEQDFPMLWNRYQRVLHQRNVALKDRRQFNARFVWDDELVTTGEKINTSRISILKQILPYYQSYCQELLGANYSIDLILESGWDGAEGFMAELHRDRDRDSARGFTHSGPQRADLRITLNSLACKAGASHGQYKLLVIALRLAQVRYLFESKGRYCCLLIDDLAAELDVEHRARLIKLLAYLPAQVFVTATEASLIDREHWSSHKLFHVKHGNIADMP